MAAVRIENRPSRSLLIRLLAPRGKEDFGRWRCLFWAVARDSSVEYPLVMTEVERNL